VAALVQKGPRREATTESTHHRNKSWPSPTDSSSLAGNKGEEGSLSVAEGRQTNLFNFPKVDSEILGILQLHIHVMPDLKGLR
jgi:hypothetical protein